ncbi:hypothetical protein BC829DRAFT_269630 [Chytridium lagenaria]|nr:hypothetical protein BC829DRAFT_269630 [Chytridium lagenaria]
MISERPLMMELREERTPSKHKPSLNINQGGPLFKVSEDSYNGFGKEVITREVVFEIPEPPRPVIAHAISKNCDSTQPISIAISASDDTPLITRRKGTKKLVFDSSSPATRTNAHLECRVKRIPRLSDGSEKSQLNHLFDFTSSPERRGDHPADDLEREIELHQGDIEETPEFARMLRKRREPKKRKAPRERIEDTEKIGPMRGHSLLEPERITRKRLRGPISNAAKAFIEVEAELSGEEDSGDEVVDGDIDCDLSGFIVHDNEISADSTPATGLTSRKLAGSSPDISMYQRRLLEARLASVKRSFPEAMRLKRSREEWEGEATQWGEGAEASEYYDDDSLADFVVDDDEVDDRAETSVTEDAEDMTIEIEVAVPAADTKAPEQGLPQEGSEKQLQGQLFDPSHGEIYDKLLGIELE